MKTIYVLLFLMILTSCKNNSTKAITIKEDIAVLASDAYEGRETGTKGEQEAAEYISKRFKDLGLEPKGTNGFFQNI